MRRYVTGAGGSARKLVTRARPLSTRRHHALFQLASRRVRLRRSIRPFVGQGPSEHSLATSATRPLRPPQTADGRQRAWLRSLCSPGVRGPSKNRGARPNLALPSHFRGLCGPFAVSIPHVCHRVRAYVVQGLPWSSRSLLAARAPNRRARCAKPVRVSPRASWWA